MEEKNKDYTLLSDIDHKMQFVTLMGVIDEITPVIRRKMLGSVLVEITDATLSNPGFGISLNLESKVLDEFLAVAKKSLIIELLDIKVAKNDGVIRGEVWDEREVRLYDDDGSRLKWWLEEKKFNRISDKTKNVLTQLNKLKKTNIEDNLEKLKVVTKKHNEKSTLQNKLLNLERSRYSNESRKRSIADKNISMSSEDSPKDGDKKKRVNLRESKSKDEDNKKKANSSEIGPKDRDEKKRVNLSESSPNDEDNKKMANSSEISLKDGVKKKKASSVGKANTKINTSIKDSNKRDLVVGKRKIIDNIIDKIDKKSEESEFVGPDVSKKNKLTTSPRSLRGVTDNSVKHDTSVSQLTSSNNKAPAQKHNLKKSEDKMLDKKFNQEKTVKNIVKRTSIKSSESSSSDLSLNLGRKTRQHKNESSISDNDSPKNINLKEKTAKEKLTVRLSKSKDRLSRSTSNFLNSSNSIDSEVSINEEPVISSPVKKNIAGKSQKDLVKQREKRNEPKEIQNKSSSITKEISNKITPNCGSKINRSNSSMNISQLKVQERKGTLARYSSPLRNRILNTSIGKLNKDLKNTKQKKLRHKSLPDDKVEEMVDAYFQNRPSVPTYDAANTSKDGGKIMQNIDKTKNVDSKRNDSCIPKTLEKHEESSKQYISKKNITTLSQKNLLNKKFMMPRTSTQGGNIKTLKRKSKSENDVKTPSNKNDIISRLTSLTRKIHVVEVETNGDVSTCDIEDVDVPEKMDLRCKVLSDFYLFEDNIQIIRVQDGTICKTPTLCIPEKGSWEEIVETVVQSPTINEKSPFIDIIIFDFPLMENRIVSGEMYEFSNIMAIRLNLKGNQRSKTTSNVELFFCTKGPDIYNKKLRPKIRQEIEKRLGEENYKQLLAEVLGNNKINKEKSDGQLEDVLSSCKTPIVCHNEPLHTDSSLQKTSSPTNKKRKLDEPEMDVQASERKNQKVDSGEKTTEKEALRNKDAKNLPKPNPAALSDETMLGETEGLIIKELSEIMHEESGLELPRTLTEDIHLKNSGSEVTFSQFCAGAEGKHSNFRTSTQVPILSEDIVPLSQLLQKEVSPTSDSSKMEPLVYCPSSCSLSDIVSPKKTDKSPRKTKNVKQCSESIIQNYTLKPVADDQSTNHKVENCNNVEKDTGETLTNEDKDLEKTSTNKEKDVEELSPDSSLFVEVLSSNSSVIEVKVVNQEDSANANKNTINKTNPSETSKLSEDAENLKENVCETSPMKLAENRNNHENELENETLTHSLHKETEGSSFDNDNEDDMSILNSTILYSPVKNNIHSVKTERSFYVSPSKNNICEIMDPKVKSENYNRQYPSSFDNGKKISDSCFFQIAETENLYPSTEEINHGFNEENNSLKFFSYSHGQHLPFLTFDVIHKLENSNYITVAVTIEKIVPSITDSWKDECIKARCPCCNKLYSAYNALNNKCNENSISLNALYVRGFIVCPESQCCNQVLETPEFHFTVDTKLKDGSLVTALIAGIHAEQLFGCKAQDAARDETALSRIEGILQKIATKMDNKQFIKMDFKRENICNPNSGPLYIRKLHF